jgi:hypothetical protein
MKIQVTVGILLFLSGTKTTSTGSDRNIILFFNFMWNLLLILGSFDVEEIAQWNPSQPHPRLRQNVHSHGQIIGESSGSGAKRHRKPGIIH